MAVSEDLKILSLRNWFSILAFFFSFHVFPKEFLFSKTHSVGWMAFTPKQGIKCMLIQKSYNFLLASVRWKQLSWYYRKVEILACCPKLCWWHSTTLKKKKSAVRHGILFSVAFSFNFISCDCAKVKGCCAKHFLPWIGGHCCGKIHKGDTKWETNLLESYCSLHLSVCFCIRYLL